MRLWLTPELARALAQHAQTESPQECCGVLAGQSGDVREIIPIKNVSPTPKVAFEMSPHELAQALTGLERRGLTLVGFYHSHPQTAPIPSGRDIAESHYPDAAYVIISLQGGTPALAAWRIGTGEIDRLELFIQATRPSPSDSEPLTLSNFQRAMTILGGLAAAAVVIGVALSLLPPPPIIQ